MQQLTSSINTMGKTTTFGYTGNDLTSITDPENQTTTISYTNHQAHAVTQFGYTNTNSYQMTSQIDPQGNTLTYGYDPNNPNNRSVMSVKDTTPNGTGTTVSYTYYPSDGTGGNGRGTLKTMTDGDGSAHIITYGYDSFGNLKTVTPPSPLGQEVLGVDGASRVSSVIDGNGLTTLFTYDNLDRVTLIQYDNGKGPSISYGLDTNGNLKTLIDTTGTTTIKYDAANRITKKTLPDGQIISTGYDGVGNLTSFTDGGGLVSYHDSKVNLVDIITEPDGQQTHFDYTNANQRKKETLPNGVVVSMDYDKAGHQSSNSAVHGSTTLFSESYSYLLDGTNTPTSLMQTRTDTLDNHQWRYSYDSMNRLTRAPVYDTTSNTEIDDFEYNYDNAGNRTSEVIHLNSPTATYSYNNDNEMTTRTQLGQTTLNYSYYGQGNLQGSTPGGQSYGYNNKNQTKTIGSTSYTYSGATQADRVQINGMALTSSGLGVNSQKDSSGTTYFTRCSCSQLLNERTPDGKKYYYLFDGLGSVIGLTDSTGTSLVNNYDYDPFGNLLYPETHESVSNPWQYASGYFESSTGLYKFGERYYDPTRGRWTQQDSVGGSVGDPNAANRYVYANDDPVNFTDPSGKNAYTLCSNPVQVIYTGLLALAVTGIAIGTILTTPLTLGGSILIGSAIFGALVGSGAFGYCIAEAGTGFP